MAHRGIFSLGRLAMLLVAAAFFVLPSAAFAQSGDGGGGGGAVGGDQTLTQEQTGAGGGAVSGDGGGDAGSESSGDASGGDNNQIQQGAQQNCTIGGDGECNQSITQNAQINSGGGGGVSTDTGRRVQFVRNVPLAQTGFDAWMVALLGGLSLAGGLGLLAAQRRGSSSR